MLTVTSVIHTGTYCCIRTYTITYRVNSVIHTDTHLFLITLVIFLFPIRIPFPYLTLVRESFARNRKKLRSPTVVYEKRNFRNRASRRAEGILVVASLITWTVVIRNRARVFARRGNGGTLSKLSVQVYRSSITAVNRKKWSTRTLRVKSGQVYTHPYFVPN